MPVSQCAECASSLPPVPRGRPRRYCSRRCQARAYRRRRDLGRAVASRTAPTHPESAHPEPAGPVSRELLVDLACRTADAHGIAAVSLRALAHQARLRPGHVHRWVRDHEDLLGAMVESALTADRARHARRPDPAHPRDLLEVLARDEWALYRRHPWLLPVLATTRPPRTPALLAAVDRTVTALIRAGHPPADAFSAFLALSGYVQGMALLHVAERGQRETGAAAWNSWWRTTRTHLERTGRTHGRPWLAHSAPTAREADAAVDHWFAFGLTRLIDGLLPEDR